MKLRRTKIVCTIGPSCCRRDSLEKLVRAGMDVARLNFSHGSHDTHAAAIRNLRHLSERLSRPLPILQDLSGPKVRLGSFTAASISLKRRDVLRFTAAPCQHTDSPDHIPLPVPELLRALRVGSVLLLDDGKIEMKIKRIDAPGDGGELTIWARVVAGGELKPNKGVTAPGLSFSMPAITDKDIEDLRFGLINGVDLVAASYVRTAADLHPLFEVMNEMGRRVPVIAKIEKFEAVQNLASILNVVDGIMVARGDLGVEMPFDEVPIVQKMIIKECNRAGKPVITATQMLESMMTCPRPTRAEATDVTNAIFDGTDAVMLSGETASGEYPDTAVKTMARIAPSSRVCVPGDLILPIDPRLRPGKVDITTAVTRARQREIAEKLEAKAILCATIQRQHGPEWCLNTDPQFQLLA